MSQTIHIKICGITNREDARAAAEAGADALGLVFAPSPRQVCVEQVAAIAEAAPGVELAGVFVSEPYEDVRRAVDAGVRGVQMHRAPEDVWPAEDAASFRSLAAERGLRVVAAVRAKDSGSLRSELAARAPGASQVLLDAFVPGQEGGTGKTFDWALVEAAGACGKPVIVAGGLTPDNVSECVRRARPWGVDVSSGVESSPGVKDHAAVCRFIQAARQAAEGTWVW